MDKRISVLKELAITRLWELFAINRRLLSPENCDINPLVGLLLIDCPWSLTEVASSVGNTKWPGIQECVKVLIARAKIRLQTVRASPDNSELQGMLTCDHVAAVLLCSQDEISPLEHGVLDSLNAQLSIQRSESCEPFKPFLRLLWESVQPLQSFTGTVFLCIPYFTNEISEWNIDTYIRVWKVWTVSPTEELARERCASTSPQVTFVIDTQNCYSLGEICERQECLFFPGTAFHVERVDRWTDGARIYLRHIEDYLGAYFD